MSTLAEARHKKTILVLSDNDGLSRAIEVNLTKRFDAEIVRHDSLEDDRIMQNGDFDLIVVAMSSTASEPVVALAQASLAKRIGQTPMLIISDRPFDSEPHDRIVHLDFPFRIDRLCARVQEMLGSKPKAAQFAGVTDGKDTDV